MGLTAGKEEEIRLERKPGEELKDLTPTRDALFADPSSPLNVLGLLSPKRAWLERSQPQVY